jgi:hypothetical protein
MHFAAGGSPVAVKRRAVEQVNKVKNLPVLSLLLFGNINTVVQQQVKSADYYFKSRQNFSKFYNSL